MNLLLDLSLHGSATFCLVWGLDRLLAARVNAAVRRVAWTMVPLAFLLAIPIPILPAPANGPLSAALRFWAPARGPAAVTSSSIQPAWFNPGAALIALWALGATAYLLIAFIRTVVVLRRWTHARLSTDAELLGALEDCKETAGITAPIGLVVSGQVFAPVILGWLRPRILLPAHLATSLSARELRGVLSHELAHFRALDVPLSWLYTLAGAVHWFNPLAHLAGRGWAAVREEAADEDAIAWLRDASGVAYGETLLRVLREANGHPAPFSALAITESVRHLQDRITMIKQHQKKSPHYLLAGMILTMLAVGAFIRPIQAQETDPRPAAVAAMKNWLGEIDGGLYEQSWKDASPSFQTAITTGGWAAALKNARTPLGKCLTRTLASSEHQTQVPSAGGAIQGDFVVAQFDASFENLKYAVETVCFEKAADGKWLASGYYVKPKL